MNKAQHVNPIQMLQENYVWLAGHIALVELRLKIFLERGGQLERPHPRFEILIDRFCNICKITEKEKETLHEMRRLLRNACLHGDITETARNIQKAHSLENPKAWFSVIGDTECKQLNPSDNTQGLYENYLSVTSAAFVNAGIKTAIQSLSILDNAAEKLDFIDDDPQK